jgi:hypothetical protein
MSTQQELKVIGVLLEEAMEYGLEAEVVHSALKAMQEDNTLHPSQAIQYAMEDWIK